MAHSADTSGQLLQTARRRALLTLCGFVGLSAAKVFAVRCAVLGSVSPAGLLLDVGFVLVAFATLDLLFADMRFRALFIADAAFSALLIAVMAFVSYYGVLPTRESLALLEQATTVGGGIVRLFDWRALLLVADLPVLALYAHRMRSRGLDPSTRLRSGAVLGPAQRTPYVYQSRPVYVIAALVAVPFLLGVSQVRSLPVGSDAKSVSRRHGLSTYVVASVAGVGAADSHDPSPVEVRAASDRVTELLGTGDARPVPGFTPGMAAGRNVIIVQIEALQTTVVGLRTEGRPVAPNLERLIERSYYCADGIAGIGLGTTSDAEFVTNTSLLPAPAGPSALRYASREVPSLPRSLSARGYHTLTLHTNDASYWNRSQLYPALGFDRYYDAGFFGDEDRIAFGASDEVLYRRTLEELVRLREAEEPFYAHVIAMSSHYPFIGVPHAERKLGPRGSYKGTLVGDYLTEINYADRMLGEFVEGLERSGLLDESVLVVYGDHFGLQDTGDAGERRALRELLGRDFSPVDRLRVPIAVRLPGQTEGVRLDRAVGQVDITPTIADALGLDLSDMLIFGRSAFREGPSLVSAGGLFPPGAYVEGDTLFVPGDGFADGRVHRVSTGEELALEYASESSYEAMLELSRLSDRYVRGLPVRLDYDAEATFEVPPGQ